MLKAAPVLVLALAAAVPASAQSGAVQPTRFAGTWVGTQSWAIADPPPGSRNDQPVTLMIDVVDGRVQGTMTPFLGGDDGATFVEATIVGDELHAKAIVGRPRPAAGGDAAAAGGGRRGGPQRNWKEAVAITFVFKGDGAVQMSGAGDVMLGDVKWMSFRYDLSRKRSRY
jgi:hypothetical protein